MKPKKTGSWILTLGAYLLAGASVYGIWRSFKPVGPSGELGELLSKNERASNVERSETPTYRTPQNLATEQLTNTSQIARFLEAEESDEVFDSNDPTVNWSEYGRTDRFLSAHQRLSPYLVNSPYGEAIGSMLLLQDAGDASIRNDRRFHEQAMKLISNNRAESLIALRETLQRLPVNYQGERNFLLQFASTLVSTPEETHEVGEMLYRAASDRSLDPGSAALIWSYRRMENDPEKADALELRLKDYLKGEDTVRTPASEKGQGSQ